MRIMGYNGAAILGAALAIYAVGALIYGVLVSPEVWMASQGITQAELDAIGTSRLPFSVLPPLITALGMAILFRLAGVTSVKAGVTIAALIGVFSAAMAIWYGWVYGVGGLAGPLLDSAHLLAGHCVAGAILGRWN